MAPPLKIGLNVAFLKPEAMPAITRAAEAAGYESVWFGEHVALPKRDDWWLGYPGNPPAEDDMTFRPENLWLDPLIMFAHLAGTTSRIRFGVGIYMIALRNPILLGRTLATLDLVTQGRLDLGIGLGWSKYEYDYTENDYHTRGRRTDECLEALRALFSPDDVYAEYHGKLIDFDPIAFLPKPVQHPLPIHVGGYGEAAIRRTVRFGDGYYGRAELIPAVKQALRAAGRPLDGFEFSCTQAADPEPGRNAEILAELADKGLTRAIVSPWKKRHTVHGLEAIEIIQEFAEQIGLKPQA